MRTAVAICVLLGAVSLLPILGFAQSGSTGVFTAAKTLCSSPGESAASPEPSPEPAPPAHSSPRRGIGAGVRVSSLGVGAELAVEVTRRTNLRAGVNGFSYSHGFSKDGVSYAGSLSLQSAEAHYDWYPLGGIHFSPGLIAYNHTKLSATASVPGGSTLTLDGVQYMSDPSNPVSGNGKLEVNKVAPTFMLGLGNLVRRRGRRGLRLFSLRLMSLNCVFVSLIFSANCTVTIERPSRLVDLMPKSEAVPGWIFLF